MTLDVHHRTCNQTAASSTRLLPFTAYTRSNATTCSWEQLGLTLFKLAALQSAIAVRLFFRAQISEFPPAVPRNPGACGSKQPGGRRGPSRKQRQENVTYHHLLPFKTEAICSTCMTIKGLRHLQATLHDGAFVPRKGRLGSVQFHAPPVPHRWMRTNLLRLPADTVSRELPESPVSVKAGHPGCFVETAAAVHSLIMQTLCGHGKREKV